MGFFDDIFEAQQNKEITACVAAGNEAAASITQRRNDLSQNWNPSGFYSPEQVEEIIDVIGKMAGSAVEALDATIADISRMPGDADENYLRSERNGLVGEVDKAANFMTAVQAVRDNGSGVIDAPGLKSWVLSVLARTDSSVTAAATTACNQPWWAGLYKTFSSLLHIAWSVVKAIAGVVAAVGQFVAGVPDTLSRFKTLLKWTAIIGGGTLAILFIRRELIARNLVPSAIPESWQLPD